MKKLFAFLVFSGCLLAASLGLAVTGLDDTPVGPNVPSTGKFTNLEATGTFTLGGETATNISGIDGKNTKVSNDDTTPGFLNGKLVPGNGISLTENNGGGNETLSISANDKLTTKGDVLTHDGSNENRLPVGSTGQVLVVDPAVANGVKWGDINTIDEDDGVEITFTREFQYDPGTGEVDAIDINGTDLVISQTDPTVTLGGQARAVLSTSDIPNTTPQLQQVIIDMPSSLTAGNYKIKLTNTQGKSEAFIPLSEITSIGGNDAFTKLLLHGDGVGASFTDSSASVHSVTANGNATQSANQSKFGGKSMLFDGSGDYLSVPDSDDFDFGSGNFTVDGWVRRDGTQTGDAAVIGQWLGGSGGAWLIDFNNAQKINIYFNNTLFMTSTAVLGDNTWHHIALVRDGLTSTKLFIDGVLDQTYTSNFTISNSTHAVALGCQNSGGYCFKGYLDEFRISKGIARWTANFTPPTGPYN